MQDYQNVPTWLFLTAFHHLNTATSLEGNGNKQVPSALTTKSRLSSSAKWDEATACSSHGHHGPIRQHYSINLNHAADVFLWRNKKISAGVLGGATAVWVFFELLEYHLVTLLCHLSIFSLAVLFLWSNASNFLNKPPPKIPEVVLSEKCVREVASGLRIEINRGFVVLRDIASGRDLKKFLAVIAGLWALSLVGSCCNILTLLYISFVLLHTVPVLYEKYEDQVDAYSEKTWIEIKKQYAVLDEKYLSKIPKGPLKEKKKD